MKTNALEVLQELVTAIKALRNETIGGVLPEVSREVRQDTRIRFEEAIQDATEFLHAK